MNRFIIQLLIIIVVLMAACSNSRIGDQDSWLTPPIDRQSIFEGEGEDDIPAIDQPQFTIASQVDFLADTSIVLGIHHNGIVRAYPLDILHWHEVVNDMIGETPIAITYSALSGSGVAFERVSNNGVVFELGVTGLLFNANLILFDRLSETNWLQIQGRGVKGLRIGQQLKEFSLIEMKWATWKLLFPNSEVLNVKTGFNRPYQAYPYGDYRTDTFSLFFPLTIPIEDLDRPISYKDKALGVVVAADTLVFPLTVFPEEGLEIVEQEIGGEPILVVGSQEHQVMAAYNATRADGSIATFQVENDLFLRDDRGTSYNLLGQSIDGASNEFLMPVNAKTAFWFNWAVWSHPNLVKRYE